MYPPDLVRFDNDLSTLSHEVALARFISQPHMDVSSPVNDSGWTLMHTAAKYDHPALIKEIISRNPAALVQCTKVNWSPLHTSIEALAENASRELLRHDRDKKLVNMQTNEGWTALHEVRKLIDNRDASHLPVLGVLSCIHTCVHCMH